MLAAVGADGAFLLNGFVAAAGSTFLWIGFITKLLCNLLQMSCTKKIDFWIGWASFGGEEGAGTTYQKICNKIKTPNGLVGMSCDEQQYQKEVKPSYWRVCPFHQRKLCTWLEASEFQEVILIDSTNCLCHVWSLMSSIVSSLRSSGKQGKIKGQAVPDSFLLSFPLHQNWMQTFSDKSLGKISPILIFG
jgi:hypothetical protein